MEHDEMDDSRWVDERLSSLDPAGDWQPDSSAAFAKLRRRHAPSPHRWWLWASLSATAAAACAVFLLVSTPPACANPLGCQPTPGHGAPAPVRNPPAPVRNPPAPVRIPSAAPSAAGIRDLQPEFKQSGSPTAPVTCELFTDFECPHCAAFYLETVPLVSARYVRTGMVRLIHRDFPLRQHRYARLAALYADAAGEAGYYDAAVNKLYRTQAVWSADGNVDAQVAIVVPPADMENVRTKIRDSRSVENLVAADEAAARENHIARTPTLLCNGQVIGPNLSFSQIEAQIDPLVAPR
jgi:protein-disulfide isomerase